MSSFKTLSFKTGRLYFTYNSMSFWYHCTGFFFLQYTYIKTNCERDRLFTLKTIQKESKYPCLKPVHCIWFFKLQSFGLWVSNYKDTCQQAISVERKTVVHSGIELETMTKSFDQSLCSPNWAISVYIRLFSWRPTVRMTDAWRSK